uniref:Uncharacterized protein n=1 Tax=Oryza punctata TaxID=4537 RepID=A0A0E0LZE0_ORYPU
MGLKSPPKATVDVDKWKTSYVFGRSLVNPKALQWKKDKVIRDDQIKAIQESLAGFITDQVINPEGAYHFDGRLQPKTFTQEGPNLDDPNFE